MERSVAGRPEAALGVSPSPERHFTPRRRAAVCPAGGRAARGPGATLYGLITTKQSFCESGYSVLSNQAENFHVAFEIKSVNSGGF